MRSFLDESDHVALGVCEEGEGDSAGDLDRG
jgi:hypothetical protein